MSTQILRSPDKRNSIYYWNNLYNPNLVRESIRYNWNRSWARNVQIQKSANLDETLIYHLSDFKRDSIFCFRHHIAQSTYILSISNHPLLYTQYTKDDFLHEIGYDKSISLEETLFGSFPKTLIISIAGFFLPNIKIMEMPNETYILIEPDIAIPNNVLQALLERDAVVEIAISAPSDVIKLSGTIDNIFAPNSINLLNLDKIVKYRMMRSIVDTAFHRHYKIYFTAHHSMPLLFRETMGIGENLTFDITYGKLRFGCRSYLLQNCLKNDIPFQFPNKERSEQIIFPETAINGTSISKNEITIYAVQERNETRIKPINLTESDNKLNTVFHPSLVYKTVPINPCNIRVTEALGIDGEVVFGERLDKEISLLYPYHYFTQDSIQYPASSYQAELPEVDGYYINSQFDDPLASWYHYYSNGDNQELSPGTLPIERDQIEYPNYPIDEYQPLFHFTYDYDDYINHPFYLDIRGYDISKLLRIHICNPRYFNRYIFNQYQNVKLQDNEAISNPQLALVRLRRERDTRFFNDDESTIMKFDRDMRYIIYTSNDNKDHFVELFVDGKREYSMYQEVMTHQLYAFYDVPEVEETEIVVTVCKWKRLNKHEIEFSFPGKYENIGFPDSKEMWEITIGDLMYVDKYTETIIDPSEIEYELGVNEDEINSPFIDNRKEPVNINVEYFLTHDVEYYSTVSGQKIALSDNYELIPPPSIEDKDGENYTDPDYVDSKKVIDSSHLEISTTEEKNVNKELIVTNTNNGNTGIIQDLSRSENKVVGFTHFSEDPRPERFRAYHNGRLLKRSEYRYEPPEKYQDDVLFYFDNFDSGMIILDYIPYREELVWDDDIPNDSRCKFYNGNGYYQSKNFLLIDTSRYVDYPVDAEMVKVWIDGYRVNPNRIYPTPALGYILVEVDNLELDEETITSHRLTLYFDKIDNDCFSYGILLGQCPVRGLLEYLPENRALEYITGQFYRYAIKRIR